MWAFIGVWLVVAGWSVIEQVTSSSAERQRWRIEALSDENKFYCTGFGFRENTHEFSRCVLDLDEVRQKERERISAIGFVP